MTIENLGARRAGKTGDCRDWTVVEALEEVLAQIRCGDLDPDMVYIALHSTDSPGRGNYTYKAAGGSKLELLGLLCRHMNLVQEP